MEGQTPGLQSGRAAGLLSCSKVKQNGQMINLASRFTLFLSALQTLQGTVAHAQKTASLLPGSRDLYSTSLTAFTASSVDISSANAGISGLSGLAPLGPWLPAKSHCCCLSLAILRWNGGKGTCVATGCSRSMTYGYIFVVLFPRFSLAPALSTVLLSEVFPGS